MFKQGFLKVSLLALSLTLNPSAAARLTSPNTNPPTNAATEKPLVLPQSLNHSQWDDSRSQYVKALDHLQSGQSQAFLKAQQSLKDEDYPLASYLTYYDYSKRINRVTDEEIVTFIDENWDSPIAAQLKNKWLESLVKREQWDDFIQHFVPETDAISQQILCHQAMALYKKGQYNQAFNAAESLWLVGRSQDTACDAIFAKLKAHGKLTDALIWKRIALSMDRGNLTLSRFLAKKLKSKGLEADFQLWNALFSAPHRLPKHFAQLKDTPEHRQIILHVLSRWVRQDKDQTLQWLNYAMNQYNFTFEEKDEYLSYIARYISFTFNPESKRWLLEVDMDNSDEKVFDKRLEIALRSQDWPAVILWTSKKPKNQWEASRLLYWKSRAIEALGTSMSEKLITGQWPSVDTNSILFIHRLMKASISTPHGGVFLALGDDYQPHQAQMTAQKIYSNLAGARDFYGFLASHRLATPLSLNHQATNIPANLLEMVSQQPGFQRAKELKLLDKKSQAMLEWRNALKNLPNRDKGVASILAQHWGWNYEAIITAGQSTERNNLELRFPTTFEDTIIQSAEDQGIAKDWVFAVIRQESAYRPEVRSPVGALGLMQIMPATARHISRNIGATQPSTQKLLTPKYNIHLGTAYLKELYETFDGNSVMATAAYNAGPHRVKEWRPQFETMPGDLWIDTIPFHETREYVKNILTYQAIYKFRTGYKPELSEDVQFIHPPMLKPLTLPTQIVANPQQPKL